METKFALTLILITSFFLNAAENDNRKTMVLTLGMHRSGTSVTTGTLALMGLFLGTSLVGKARSNPKGHFEDRKTMRLDKNFLEKIGSSWYDPEPIDIDWSSKEAQEFKEAIKQNWSEELLLSNIFGVKDPVMCLLLPLYIEIAQELDCDVKLIVVHRDFREIALSLSSRARRAQITRQHAYRLTEKYMTMLERYLENTTLPVLHITFNDLLNNTDEILLKFKEFLPMLTLDDQTKHNVHVFVDKGLKHYNI